MSRTCAWFCVHTHAPTMPATHTQNRMCVELDDADSSCCAMMTATATAKNTSFSVWSSSIPAAYPRPLYLQGA
jgi:hypothetical protein